MDNRSDRFGSGFVAGTIFGSIVGGLLGAFLASRLPETLAEDQEEGAVPRPKRRRQSLEGGSELNIEDARQGLETKIAQLNDAIDDVRQQLSNVNGRD
jgi:hypothetical protein